MNDVWFCRYLEAREHFVAQHNLPRDFPFYVYLRKCMRDSMQGIAGVHWNVWVIVLICAFFNAVRVDVYPDMYGGTIEYFVVTYVTFALATALW